MNEKTKLVNKKAISGRVVSISGDKTIAVLLETVKVHPLYKKKFKISKKYLAHDEKNEAKKDDVVEIIPTKPISKRKRFKLSKVIKKAEVIDKVEAEILESKEAVELVEVRKERKEEKKAESEDSKNSDSQSKEENQEEAKEVKNKKQAKNEEIDNDQGAENKSSK